MGLMELRDYLMRQEGHIPLHQLALHFGKEPEVIRGMLWHWQRKGRVRRIVPACASGCGGCGGGAPEAYAWVEEGG